MVKKKCLKLEAKMGKVVLKKLFFSEYDIYRLIGVEDRKIVSIF